MQGSCDVEYLSSPIVFVELEFCTCRYTVAHGCSPCRPFRLTSDSTVERNAFYTVVAHILERQEQSVVLTALISQRDGIVPLQGDSLGLVYSVEGNTGGIGQQCTSESGLLHSPEHELLVQSHLEVRGPVTVVFMYLDLRIRLHIVYVQGIVRSSVPFKNIMSAQFPLALQACREGEAAIGLEPVPRFFAGIEQTAVYIQVPLPRQQETFSQRHQFSVFVGLKAELQGRLCMLSRDADQSARQFSVFYGRYAADDFHFLDVVSRYFPHIHTVARVVSAVIGIPLECTRNVLHIGIRADGLSVYHELRTQRGGGIL